MNDNSAPRSAGLVLTDAHLTEVATVTDEFGVTVIGDEDAVDAYLHAFAIDTGATPMSLPPLRLQQTFSGGGLLARLGKHTIAKYMSNHDIVSNLVTAEEEIGPVPLAELRLVSRDPVTGRFLSNTLVSPEMFRLPPVTPELIAIQVALQHITQQLNEIQREVADAREDIRELLALANAQRLGDVYGHYRVLSRQMDALDKGQTLTATDWSSLASLGPVIEVGVERLRAYLSESTKGLDPSSTVEKRADKLAALVARGEFVRTLELLLVAQQSEFLWQRIRLERVRTTEPQALEQTVSNTRQILSEHLEGDRQLAEQLREILENYAVLKVTEVHRIGPGRKLAKSRRSLSDGVDQFVELRTRQAAGWGDLHDATYRDAIRAAADFAGGLATEARRGIAAGVAAAAKWVDPDTSAPNPDSAASNGQDSSKEQATPSPDDRSL